MMQLKQRYGTAVIANLGGHSEEEYVEGAALLDVYKRQVWRMIKALWWRSSMR